jgi:hypothetical protein
VTRRVDVPGRTRSGATVYAALFAVAVAVMIWTVLSTAYALQDIAFRRAVADLFTAMLAAGILYLASHFVRIARLALIASDARISLRTLSRVHLFTSAVGLTLPFKLGDAYRAVELSALAGGPVRGITMVVVERLCDVSVILLLLVVAASLGPTTGGAYAPVLFASLAFVLAILVATTLLPDNLRRIGTYIIRRHTGDWTVYALRRIAHVRGVIRNAMSMLNGRLASLFAFTLLIWMLEATSLAIVFATDPPGFRPLETLLAFLSSITEGSTLPGRLSPEQLSAMPTTFAAYLAATQVPLVFIGLAAGATLMIARLRVSPVVRHRRVGAAGFGPQA